MQDNQYTSRDQCILSPNFCRIIDALVKTSVLLVLLSVLVLMHHSRTFCCWSNILQCYRYTSHEQCVVSGSEMGTFFIFKNFHVIYHHMEPSSWCLEQGLEIYLIKKIQISYEKIQQNYKITTFFPTFKFYISFLYQYN